MDIAGYKTLQRLGIGGMATVYLAIQENLERKVALKVMKASYTDSYAFSKRFLREAKIIAQLSHPNIIPVYDVGVCGNHYYIAMEYESGGELKSKVKNGLAINESIDIIKQIANALHYAHENGYVHRDVKPDNILFNAHNKALLSDFGVARTFDSNASITAAGTLMGTPLYMSPEQVQGKPTDARSDLYSLGVVTYELLTGQPPFIDNSPITVAVKHLTECASNLRPSLSRYQPLIDKFLNKDPNQRWQTGKEIIAALDSISSAPINNVYTVAADQEPPLLVTDSYITNEKKSRWRQWAVIGLFCISAFGVSFWLQNDQFNLKIFSSQAAPLEQAPKKIPQIAHEQEKVDKIPEIYPIAAQRQMKHEQTQNLLQQAKSLLSQNKQDAAQLIFTDVYTNDIQNEQARRGLLSISNTYLATAKLSINDKKWDETITYIEKAKAAFDKNPDIERVITHYKQAQRKEQQRIEQRRKIIALKKLRAKEKENKLSNIATKVDELLKNTPVTVKMFTTAQDLLKQAAMVSAKDKRISDMQDKLVNAYIIAANKALSVNNHNRAEFIAELGLNLSPTNTALLVIKLDIQNRIKTNQLVSELIAKIDSELNNKPVNLQQLELASQTYKKAISLAPSSFLLQEKRASIVRGYIDASSSALTNKDYESVNKITIKGLEIDPENITLSSYQRRAFNNRSQPTRQTPPTINISTF